MKPNRFVSKATTDLHFLRFPAEFENLVAARCLNCASELTLHQPDMDLPERLLGICEACKYWYLIDLVRDANQGVMVCLPDIEVVRELSHQNPSDGISLMGPESNEGLPAPPDEPGSTP